MIDISSVGTVITVKFKSGGSVTISEFSDEGTPFAGSDIDLSVNQKNLNGQMISSRMPSVYRCQLTVIPGSEADVELAKHAQKAAIQPGNVSKINDIVVESLVISVPNINESSDNSSSNGIKYTYTNGRMKTSANGPSTSAQGRMNARTYVFEFEKYSITGSGANVNS